MPSHGPQNLEIELLNGKQPPRGPIHYLYEMELDTIRSNLKIQLRRGWIRLSKSPAGALVFFVTKNDITLRL